MFCLCAYVDVTKHRHRARTIAVSRAPALRKHNECEEGYGEHPLLDEFQGGHA